MGYTIVFMVNGEYEIVNVPYGTELSESLTSLDIEGVNHWVYVKDTGSNTQYSFNGLTGLELLTGKTTNLGNSFMKFSFTDKNRLDVEKQAQKAADAKIQFALVLVANFQESSKTSYAVFDANDYAGKLNDRGVSAGKTQDTTIDGEKVANFGSELITKIVVSGETGKDITILPQNPVIMDDVTDNDKFLYLNWFLHTYVGSDSSETLEFKLDLGDFTSGKISYISADWEKYKNTITFHVGDKINGVFYYKDVNSKNASDDDIDGKDIFKNLVAFQYESMLYPSYLANMKITIDFNEYNNSYAFDLAATDALAHVLDPFKAGYALNIWSDAPSNGNKMIDDVDSTYILRKSGDKNQPTKYIIHDNYYSWFDKLTESADFYASFSPLFYFASYESNSADFPNTIYQLGFADQKMLTLDEKAFGNNKVSELLYWSDRADANGKRYDLGAELLFTGEQLDALGITAYNTSDVMPSNYEAGQTFPGNVAGEYRLDCVLTLFGIWQEKSDSSQGGSSGGNDDTNTYLLVGILIVIIILVLAMVVLMRKKN